MPDTPSSRRAARKDDAECRTGLACWPSCTRGGTLRPPWAITHGNATARAHASSTIFWLPICAVACCRCSKTYPQTRRFAADTRSAEPTREALALINDTHDVVAAAAIDLVRSEELWTLVGDVEHVLAHRDARDWLVFEAASWALAEHRLTPEGRRSRWVERLPAIVLADRLRSLSMFGSVTIEEICRLASSGRQLRHDDQAMLLQEGVVPDVFHVLLDGSVIARPRGGADRRINGPILIGFEAALEGHQAAETIRANGPVVTVAVSRGRSSRTIRTSSAVSSAPRGGARRARQPSSRERLTQSSLRDQLAVTDRALQQVPMFATLPTDELGQLAGIAHAVALQEGQLLSDETDPPVCCVVITGSLSLREGPTEAERCHAGPGDTVGLFETLGITHSSASPTHRRSARLSTERPPTISRTLANKYPTKMRSVRSDTCSKPVSRQTSISPRSSRTTDYCLEYADRAWEQGFRWSLVATRRSDQSAASGHSSTSPSIVSPRRVSLFCC